MAAGLLLSQAIPPRAEAAGPFAAGPPARVLPGAILWPERVPKDRTVEAIRQRTEDEGDPPPAP
ncbi:hypothetical protein IU470_13385 [Nocardia abscessus]|uniref:Uncharacterized protein n=1 Tax=Nocardia abscessus TaxID=120957 RepID=A0ABS0C6T4_9NOCA|nr:hypothetical protein [Nocardia abscessus]MBF6226088.1 hypothetical protein [Nocardia abscessus]